MKFKKKYLLIVAILLTLLLVGVGLLSAHLSSLRPEPEQPPILSMGSFETLNPESTPTKLSLEQAVKAVESIWSLPDTAEIRFHLRKDHYLETIVWELQWRRNDEIVLAAAVEANSGEVLAIFDWGGLLGTEDKLKDPSKAIRIALDLLKKLGVPTQNLSEPQVTREEHPAEKFAYKVFWRQKHHEVIVPGGSVSVSIDPQDGKPISFGRYLMNTEGISTEPQISKEKAEVIARDYADYLSTAHPKFKNILKIGRMIQTKLAIEKTTTYWTEWRGYGDRALIWIVRMEKIEPHSGFIEIWVDALNGEVVGGGQTR